MWPPTQAAQQLSEEDALLADVGAAQRRVDDIVEGRVAPDPQLATDADELSVLTGVEYKRCIRALLENDGDVNVAAGALLGLE